VRVNVEGLRKSDSTLCSSLALGKDPGTVSTVLGRRRSQQLHTTLSHAPTLSIKVESGLTPYQQIASAVKMSEPCCDVFLSMRSLLPLCRTLPLAVP
jgi:hypothetical protein